VVAHANVRLVDLVLGCHFPAQPHIASSQWATLAILKMTLGTHISCITAAGQDLQCLNVLCMLFALQSHRRLHRSNTHCVIQEQSTAASEHSLHPKLTAEGWKPYLNMARKPLSVKPSVYLPMSMGSLRLMVLGTVASISSSSEPKPVTLTISATSSSEALLWRNAKLHAAVCHVVVPYAEQVEDVLSGLPGRQMEFDRLLWCMGCMHRMTYKLTTASDLQCIGQEPGSIYGNMAYGNARVAWL